MQILKIGDEFSISGYESITLSDDMEENIQNFAQVNNISQEEAECILNAQSDFQNFIKLINSVDEEEEYDINDFDNLDNLTDSSNNFLVQNDTVTYETIAVDDNDIQNKKLNNEQSETDVLQPFALSNVSENFFNVKVGTSENENDNSDNVITNDVTNAPETATAINTTIITATTTSTNSNEVKNVLGLFGLDTDTTVDSLIYTGSTVTGVIINGTKYEAKLNANGIVESSQITDATGTIINETSYQEVDKIIEINKNITFTEEELQTYIEPLIAKFSVNFNDSVRDKIKKAVLEAANAYYAGNSIENLEYFIPRLLNNYGLNSSAVYSNVRRRTVAGLNIINACNELTALIDEKIKIEKTVPEYESKTENVNGINFKITYKYGSPDYEIKTLDDGTICVNGNNCTVDILGLGTANKSVKITGSNITFNNNTLTFASLTNEATQSTISGSFGDDKITNNGNYSTISGGDGDDTITNNASNSFINGDKGNDTIISYGAETKIAGGEGDDAINYLKDSATVTDDIGNDKINVLDANPTPEPPDTPGEYKYNKEFTVNGITFTVYSSEEIDTIDTSVYDNVLTITATNCKIVINKTSRADAAIKLKGDTLEFATDVQLKSVFNYANNSKISGSSYQDYLYNYAENVVISGNDGDDVISNEGDNTTISGNKGVDSIYNRQSAENTTITADDVQDSIINRSSESTQIKFTTTSGGNEVVNVDIIMDYLYGKLNDIDFSFEIEPNTNVKNNAEKGVEILLTDNDGVKELSEDALKLIEYAKSITSSSTDKSDLELLEIALDKICEEDVNDIKSAIKTFLANTAVEAELDDYLNNNTTIALLNMDEAEKVSFVNSQASKEEALNLLKQIEVILKANNNSTTTYTASTIKEILFNNQFSFNNEILEDAQILVDAQNSSDPDAYIKSKMITDGSKMEVKDMFANSSTGEVIEKDGKLYVNDGTKIVQLDISADTYLELFPPVQRYLVEQNGYSDCFFITTTLIDMMENDTGRAELLQMFSEDSSGNITITFPGVSSYPVTFSNGELKQTDGSFTADGTKYTYQTSSGSTVIAKENTYSDAKTLKNTTGAKGLQMLEQAYALAKFAEISNSNISTSDITKDYNSYVSQFASGEKLTVEDLNKLDIDEALTFYLEGGYAYEAYEDMTNNTSKTKTTDDSGNINYYVSMPASEDNAKSMLSRIYSEYFTDKTKEVNSVVTLISGNITLPDDIKSKYNLISGHQYSVEDIDCVNETVYIKNPWNAYEVTAIPFDVFIEYFYGFTGISFSS